MFRISESLESKFSKFQNFQFFISETDFLEERTIFELFLTAKHSQTSKFRQKNENFGFREWVGKLEHQINEISPIRVKIRTNHQRRKLDKVFKRVLQLYLVKLAVEIKLGNFPAIPENLKILHFRPPAPTSDHQADIYRR